MVLMDLKCFIKVPQLAGEERCLMKDIKLKIGVIKVCSTNGNVEPIRCVPVQQYVHKGNVDLIISRTSRGSRKIQLVKSLAATKSCILKHLNNWMPPPQLLKPHLLLSSGETDATSSQWWSGVPQWADRQQPALRDAEALWQRPNLRKTVLRPFKKGISPNIKHALNPKAQTEHTNANKASFTRA